eukprot:g10014.t1
MSSTEASSGNNFDRRFVDEICQPGFGGYARFFRRLTFHYVGFWSANFLLPFLVMDNHSCVATGYLGLFTHILFLLLLYGSLAEETSCALKVVEQGDYSAAASSLEAAPNAPSAPLPLDLQPTLSATVIRHCIMIEKCFLGDLAQMLIQTMFLLDFTTPNNSIVFLSVFFAGLNFGLNVFHVLAGALLGYRERQKAARNQKCDEQPNKMQAVLIFSRHRGALLGMLLDAVGISYLVLLLALSVSVTPAEGFLQFPALGNRCFPANMGESTGISRPAAEAWLRSYNLMARKLAGMSTETSASSNPFLGLRFDEHSARENTAVKLNRYAQPVRYEDFVLNWQRQETVTVMTEHGRFFAAKHTARASVGELAEDVFNVADKAIFKRHAHLHTEDEEECNLALVFNELMVAQLNSRRHEAYPQSDLVYFLQTITRLSQSVLRYVFRFWAETGHGWRVLLLGGQGWDRHYSLTKDVVLRERRHGGEARRNVTWVGDNFSFQLRRHPSPNKPLYAPRLADPALPPATKSLSVSVAAGKPRYVNPYSTTAKWPIFTTLNALAEELVAVLRITLRQINEKKLFAAFVDEGAPRPATSRSQQRDCETTLRVGHGVGMDGKFHGSGGAERLTCRDLRRRKVQEALGSRAQEDEGEEDDPQEQNTSASRKAFLDYWAGRKAEFGRRAKLNVNHEGEVEDGDDHGPKTNITRQIITPDMIPADSTLFDEPAAPTPSLQETYEWARSQFFNVSFIDKTSEKAREFFGIFNEKLSFDVPYWVQRLQNRVQMEKQTALEMQRKELSKASRSWDHYFRYDPYDPVSESYVFLRGVETDRGGDERISRATFFRGTIQLEERLFFYDGGQSQQHQQEQQRLTESVAASTPTATKTTTRALASGTAKAVNFTERYAPHEFVLLKHEDERGHESGTSDVVVRKMNDDASRVKYDAGVFEFLRQPLSAQTLWEVDHLQAVFSDLVEAADGSLRKLPVFGNIFKAMMFRGLTGEEMDRYVACGPFFVFLQLVFRKMTLTSSSPESGTQESNFDLLGALAELEKSMNQLHNPLKTLLHVSGPARRGSHTTAAPPTNRAGDTLLASDFAPEGVEGGKLQERTRVAVVSCGLPGAATDQLRRFVEKMNPASATNDELPGAPSRGTPAADVVSFTLILVQPDLRVTLRENACFRYPLSAAVMKALEFAADNFDLDEIPYLLFGHVTRQKALAQSNLLSAVGYDSGTGLPIVEDLAFQYQDHMLNTMTLNTPVARRPAAALQRHCLFLSPKAGNLLGKLFGLIQPVCIRQAQRNAFRSIVGWWENEPIEDEEQQNSNGGYRNFPLLWKSFTLNAVRSASEFGLFPWSPDLDLELATDAPYVRKNVVTKLQEHLLLAGGPMVDGTRTSGGDATQAQVIKFEWTSVGMEEGRDDYKADYKTSFLYAPLSWQDDNGVDLNVDVYWNSNVSLIRDQQESSSTASTAARYAGASASAADGEDDAESEVADLFVMPVALDEIRAQGPSSSPYAAQMYFTERSGEFSLDAVLQSYGGEKVFSDPDLLLAAGVQDLKPDVLNPDVSDIVTDSKMYVVEFYSKFCGSCTEFLPILDQASKLLPKQSGLTLAESEGALEDGLPSLRLYYKGADGSLTFERILEPDTMDFPSPKVLADTILQIQKKVGKAAEL